MSKIDDIMDVLGSYGIHEGYPDQRRSMATQLSGHGWDEDDVELVCAHIKRTSRNAGAAGAAVLADLPKANARLKDLRRCRESAPQAAVQAPPELAGADETRMRRMAFALVQADQKSPALASDLLGISVEQVERYVREERELRRPDV